MVNAQGLKEIASRLKSARVLVLGDLMWDEYIRGDVTRISPEAPVPVLLESGRDRTPGGAANVLKNLKDLGCQIGMLGITGDDEDGTVLAHELASWGIQKKHIHLIRLADRPTTIKIRFMAKNQQLLRLDREKVQPIGLSVEEDLLARLAGCIDSFDAIILSDYDKGLLTDRVIKGATELARSKQKFVAVDPQVKHFSAYKHCGIMTPNEKEASEGVGMPYPASDNDVKKIAATILKNLELNELLITRSQRGMALFRANQAIFLPTLAREVFDVTGAGDTVISVYAAAISVQAQHEEAMVLANIAGGIVVAKLGTATVNVAEIMRELERPIPTLRIENM